jgi:DNA-binding transcriptional ArsR family regulator
MSDAEAHEPDGLTGRQILVRKAMEPGVPYTAGDLAPNLDLSRRSVDRHLRAMYKEGVLDGKKHSSGTRTYWRRDE